ncbi:hypothetical protein G6F45_011851 [Rhizopus arrhizus]|nr:hypothetical protein G6F45_011851 [Rhizopus arrhizus]
MNSSTLNEIDSSRITEETEVHDENQSYTVARRKRGPYKVMTEELWKIFWENYTVDEKNLYLAAKSIHFPEATMRKWVARVENDSTGGMPALMRRGRTASPRISTELTVFIERFLEEHGEYSLERIALLLQEEFPVDFETVISNSALHKHMRSKMDFTLKKAIIYPRRRNNPEIKLQRFNFINKIISEGIVRYNTNCIFVDETGFNLHINRTQARSKRGRPARIIVESTSRGRNVTVCAAMSHRGVELVACHWPSKLVACFHILPIRTIFFFIS